MNKIILSLLLVFSFQFLSAKISTEEISVFFQPGQSELNSSSISILDSLVTEIGFASDFEIFLSGHTDHDGTKTFNNELSKKRAESVSSYLIKKGLDKDSFTVRFFGETKPFEPNTSNNNKKMNRRVQIKLTRFVLENLTDLENALKSPSTKIQIDATKEQEVTALQGSKLRIPANAFTNAAGELISDVEISITEALDFNDFIGNNLGTLSGDQLLVTGGMLKIEAFTKGGEKLTLAEGKSLGIEVPNSKVEDGMLLFTSTSGQNWNTNGEEVLTPNSATDVLYKKKPYKIYPNFRMPIFQRDLATKPYKHSKPNLKRAPKKPDNRILNKPIKWYMLWNKKGIEKGRQEIFDARMKKYDKSTELYERRKEVYETQLINFLKNEKLYRREIKIWEEKQIADSSNFKTSQVYLDAEKDYAILVQKEDDRYDRVLAKWQLKIDSLMETKEELSSEELNRYVTRASKLSWINIDRFLKLEPWETRPITVKETDEDEKRVIIVFEELKTIIPLGRALDNNYKIRRIPKKQKAKVLAYKVMNGKAYVYYESIGKNTTYSPVYKPLKIRELRKLLDSLNG